MICDQCNNQMILLLTSYVCDYCESNEQSHLDFDGNLLIVYPSLSQQDMWKDLYVYNSLGDPNKRHYLDTIKAHQSLNGAVCNVYHEKSGDQMGKLKVQYPDLLFSTNWNVYWVKTLNNPWKIV